MGLVRTTGRRFGIAGELISFFIHNKRWWILPTVIVILLLGVLILLGQSSAVFGPFIYALG